MTATNIQAVIEEAEDYLPEQPRVLYREIPPADPFPIETLGSILNAAAKGINGKIQAPIAICGQSVLAAASLCVQAHADIYLPIGHPKPLSNFFLTIAASGERKTACDSEALWPIRRREEVLRDTYKIDLVAYENSRTAWEAARKKAQSGTKKNYNAILESLESIGPAPAAPLIPLLTCPEPTYEGLCRTLASGQPSMGVFSAEGGQFIGGHGMSEEKKLMTATGLSGLWDGEPIRRVRVSDGVMILPGRRVSMHLMAQPDVASIMLSDAILLDQGLLSRFLVTAPESTAGTRLSRAADPNDDVAIKRYGARMLSILETPMPLREGQPNELNPRHLALNPKAQAMWFAFADAIEKQIGTDGALVPIRGLANKLPEHAARLAGILALVHDIAIAEISVEHLEAGIALAQHYAAEAMRTFEASRVNAKLILAQRTLAWLQNAWQGYEISLPDIYQKGPASIRDAKVARQVVDDLEDHGWLKKLKNGAVIAGQRRKEAWSIYKASIT